MTVQGATAEQERPRRRWRRRGVRALGVFVLVLAMGLAALWVQRERLARGFVDRALVRAGVPARYTITDLGLTRQRLTNVRIGDPARPDLVADWVEVRTAYGFSGPSVAEVRAGRVVARARLVNGTVSLGAIDKLMPAPSGKPFTLPQIGLRVADARVRLDTPYGAAGLKLSGAGRLDDGFQGRLAAVMPRLAVAGCVLDRGEAALAIKVRDRAPTVAGPVRVAALKCGNARLDGLGADVDVALSEALDRARGSARLSVKRAVIPGVSVANSSGSVVFRGDSRRIDGTVAVGTGAFRADAVRAASLRLDGRYAVAGPRMGFAGDVAARGASVPTGALANMQRAAAGTPVGPLVRQFVTAAVAAGRSMDGGARLSVASEGGRGRIAVTQAVVSSASGARATLNEGAVALAWPDGGFRVSGTATLGGGGLPAMAVRLTQERGGGPVVGTAHVQPYAAGGAVLALDPVRFRASGGATQVSTQAALSGPLGDGRVERLVVPIRARWDGAGRIAVNPACAGVRFAALSVSSFRLGATQLRLCPAGQAMVAVNGGRVSGGVRTGAVRLAGAIGRTPVRLGADDARFRLDTAGFEASGIAARLGQGGSVTRIDAARLDGRVADGVVAGTFAGIGGQIGRVPLILSEADGRWRFADGALRLEGDTRVTDAAATARFEPLTSDDIVLTLVGGAIGVTGSLRTAQEGAKVADVRIAHDLGKGAGAALLEMPGITFTPEGLQPDKVTKLTFGVIAEVKGTISGSGRIAWTPQGVTSGGAFRTAGTDLAAAFGPVTGLSGEITFSDLLGLETPPGQVATIVSINPGVPVENGTVRYQLLPGLRISVERGVWPFAGGELELQPTVLAFGERQVRRMTFGVKGVDAAQFLQQFDFSNLNASGVFDGTLPMVFDERGGRIDDGRLTVRPGGGTITYVGEITKEDIGTWGNFAFQALRDLRYNSLDLVMNGALAGEIITEIRFAGVSQGQAAKRNFLIDRLAKLPLVFNVTVRAPFRQLIDSVQGWYDPKRLIERNLPRLLEEQQKRESRSVQPPESGAMR